MEEGHEIWDPLRRFLLSCGLLVAALGCAILLLWEVELVRLLKRPHGIGDTLSDTIPFLFAAAYLLCMAGARSTAGWLALGLGAVGFFCIGCDPGYSLSSEFLTLILVVSPLIGLEALKREVSHLAAIRAIFLRAQVTWVLSWPALIAAGVLYRSYLGHLPFVTSTVLAGATFVYSSWGCLRFTFNLWSQPHQETPAMEFTS